jgi:hypothetical protein
MKTSEAIKIKAAELIPAVMADYRRKFLAAEAEYYRRLHEEFANRPNDPEWSNPLSGMAPQWSIWRADAQKRAFDFARQIMGETVIITRKGVRVECPYA